MQSVEQWAELRRLHFVQGVSIKELHRRTGLHRETIRKALRSAEPPRYERAPAPSKLDPFKDEIHRLLHDDPRLPNVRVGELVAPLGYTGKQTILDAYLREVRPLFLPATRVYQRTAYRPGELAQFDLWEPKTPIPVGFGQARRAYVMVAALGYARLGAGALVFSKEAPDLLWGMVDFQEQLDGWFARRANVRTHRALRERPIDRWNEERASLRALPEHIPDVHRRLVLRVPPQPYVRIETVDYSLDPTLVGRRVEVVVTQRRVRGRVLDTGESACDHERCFARHRTVTALEHARALQQRRGEPAEIEVERRALSRYDRLIPA